MHFAYCTKTASFVWRAVLFARKNRSNLTIPSSWLYLLHLNECVDADGRCELIGHYYFQSRIEHCHLLIMGMISNVSNLSDVISWRKTWIYIYYTLELRSIFRQKWSMTLLGNDKTTKVPTWKEASGFTKCAQCTVCTRKSKYPFYMLFNVSLNTS